MSPLTVWWFVVRMQFQCFLFCYWLNLTVLGKSYIFVKINSLFRAQLLCSLNHFSFTIPLCSRTASQMFVQSTLNIFFLHFCFLLFFCLKNVYRCRFKQLLLLVVAADDDCACKPIKIQRTVKACLYRSFFFFIKILFLCISFLSSFLKVVFLF